MLDWENREVQIAMSSRLALSDQQLLDYSREHVVYELQMLAIVGAEIPNKKGYDLSAYLESFAIHLRNLIDFFFADSPRPDDVVAADFFDNPSAWNVQITPDLQAARVRANKEVGHLTLQRKGSTDSTKPWPIDIYFNGLKPVVHQFVATASPKKVDSEVNKMASLLYRPGVRLAFVAAGPFTNTATGAI
jgi:hypothetical protein